MMEAKKEKDTGKLPINLKRRAASLREMKCWEKRLTEVKENKTNTVHMEIFYTFHAILMNAITPKKAEKDKKAL